MASSGSVEGTSVGVVNIAGEGERVGVDGVDGRAKKEGVDDRAGAIFAIAIDVVVVVLLAVKRSFSSPASRTISFAFTIRASRSLSASDISVAAFWADVSTVRRMPSVIRRFRGSE